MIWSVELNGVRGDWDMKISFRVDAPGLLLLGPNGAGKTTLLRTIAGERTGLVGRLLLNDRVLMDSTKGVHLLPEERRIAYVPQGFALFPHMTVLENAAFGCAPGNEGRERAREELRSLEAEHLAQRRPYELSAGEKQRVALARALAPAPTALLLDEPLAAMDPGTRRRMRGFLADYLARAGCPVITVTHDIRDVRALGGTLLVLEEGRLTGVGTQTELTRENPGEFTREFFETDGPPG